MTPSVSTPRRHPDEQAPSGTPPTGPAHVPDICTVNNAVVCTPSGGQHLDLTALGRQENWEDSPDGYPQDPPYAWWNWHDEYGDAKPARQWSSQIERGLQAPVLERP